MKENLLPIGKMAQMNNLTVATLRLYDEMGLLHPRYVDPDTGYRYYDIEQNARLDMIVYMKELGMSLNEIADVLRREDLTLIESILISKNEQIHQQIRDLHARHDAVERAIASIERYRKSPTKGTFALEFIDRRYILGIPCTENFYEKGLRSFEHSLLELRCALAEQKIPQIHSFSTGTSIDEDDYIQGRFLPKEVFAFLDYRTAGSRRDAKVVESGMFACVYLDDFDDEVKYACDLRNFCAQQDWQISGDYICEVLTEFNIFDHDRRSMYLRLQVPVKFK
ncbi:MAG: helix-turn-helix domain-containing protein [Lachnospiraceae bacterium]|nr:helix-turn-helix domain-containing protein [Lachnospiraceae bacterium]